MTSGESPHCSQAQFSHLHGSGIWSQMGCMLTKPTYFSWYPECLVGHVTNSYHPNEKTQLG